jgi:hypothetical protein
VTYSLGVLHIDNVPETFDLLHIHLNNAARDLGRTLELYNNPSMVVLGHHMLASITSTGQENTAHQDFNRYDVSEGIYRKFSTDPATGIRWRLLGTFMS